MLRYVYFSHSTNFANYLQTHLNNKRFVLVSVCLAIFCVALASERLGVSSSACLVEQNARGRLKRKSKLEELVKATTAAAKPLSGTEYTDKLLWHASPQTGMLCFLQECEQRYRFHYVHAGWHINVSFSCVFPFTDRDFFHNIVELWIITLAKPV